MSARLAALWLVAVAPVACSGPPRPAPPRLAAPSTAPAPPAAAPAPPVLVSIVIDQFAAWIADERLPLLPPEGGFARLRREGTYVREARFDHATTDTGPGHAAIYTGAPPRETGVYANELVAAASGKRASVLSDPSTRLVGPAGPLASTPGSSPARLRAETLADRLRASAPGATIVSLSLKDRGAIPGGGRKPDAALWFDPTAGTFVTSTAFARQLPPWAARLAKPAALASAWAPLDPAWLGARAGVPDGQAGEGDWLGLGTSFPHRLGASSSPASAYRATPFGDDDLFALALAAVDAPRAPGEPFLLALSLSSHDYVGHIFGPDSWEAWDELARLDRSLGAFLGALDARLGPAGYATLLTGDHGSAPTPEAAPALGRGCRGADYWQRPCAGGGRLSPDGLADELNRAAERALGGPGAWVLNVAEPYVVLGPRARALPPLRHAVLDAALREAMARHAGVAGLVAVDEFRGACPLYGDESLKALLCRSVPAAGVAGAPDQGDEGVGGGRVGGDYYVVFEPGGYFEAYTPGKGSNHGSHYLYDRSVPIFVRAPGRARAGARVDGPLPTAAFVHTAADLLGVPPPAAARPALSLVR